MRRFSWLLLFAVTAGCEPEQHSEPPPATDSALPAPSARPAPSSALEALPSSAPVEPPLPGASPHCPEDMGLVEGSYCPLPSQPCVERPKILGAYGHEQCQRYAPARCLSRTRKPMRFCMDRYEWPNKKGELPRTLTSWPEAMRFCNELGKRLCTEHEFNFACEGESMKAHVYGDERDKTVCNFDRPYIARTFNYYKWDACMAAPDCKKEFDRLDQRLPAGSMPGCVSPHGIFDLNGNANEWVHRTEQRSPDRSGLKGGWWGPVRNRCRPMTTFHKEGDYGYEQGWRCCKDAS